MGELVRLAVPALADSIPAKRIVSRSQPRTYAEPPLRSGKVAASVVSALEATSAEDIAALRDLPPAVRRRVLRRAAIAAGAPAGSLFARHIEETDRLVTAWRGQRPLNLPGRVEARRQGGTLVLQQANQ